MNADAPTPTGCPEEMRRRTFLTKLCLGLGAAMSALIGAPVVGFLLAPFFQKKPGLWRDVGSVNDFAIGATVKVTYVNSWPLSWAGVTANTAAWLRRSSAEKFTAFSINCTHLGCPVRWEQKSKLFLCPCHGGVYYEDGTVAAGPPPQPLVQYPVRIQQGRVEIQTKPLPVV